MKLVKVLKASRRTERLIKKKKRSIKFADFPEAACATSKISIEIQGEKDKRQRKRD